MRPLRRHGPQSREGTLAFLLIFSVRVLGRVEDRREGQPGQTDLPKSVGPPRARPSGHPARASHPTPGPQYRPPRLSEEPQWLPPSPSAADTPPSPRRTPITDTSLNPFSVLAPLFAPFPFLAAPSAPRHVPPSRPFLFRG